MTSPLQQGLILARLRRELRRRAAYDASPPAARARWRAARVETLRRHAVARSPFYRHLHAGLEHAPLEDLPPVPKRALLDAFDEAVTDRSLRLADLAAEVASDSGGALARRGYRVGTSSGSSGRPALLPFSRGEWVELLVNAARAGKITGPPAVAGRPRVARVGSPSPWHLSRQVGETLRDPRKPVLRLAATRPLAELTRELGRWRPDVLSAYPSILAELAAAQLEGRLSIEPAQVLASGEALTAAVRQAIERAWGTTPLDQYATTEAGFLAVECSAHGGLHVLDDHVLVEVVDAAGAPVEAGTTGAKVLLTALSSRTLPLIRYELDDRVRLGEGPCACGREGSRLASIEAAPRELLALAGAEGSVSVHPVALTRVLDTAPVGGWQVRHRPDRLRVEVFAPRPGFDPTGLRDAVAASLAEAGATPRVEVAVVPELRRAASGKAALLEPD